MNNIESNLKMIDFYFSKIEFTNKKEKTGECKINISYNLEYLKNDNDENFRKVILTTNIKDDSNQLIIKVVANGIFKLQDDGDALDDEMKENILNINTVAIMFPYIRSQVSLITTQPGIMPIQLPIIDVNKLVSNIKR